MTHESLNVYIWTEAYAFLKKYNLFLNEAYERTRVRLLYYNVLRLNLLYMKYVQIVHENIEKMLPRWHLKCCLVIYLKRLIP